MLGRNYVVPDDIVTLAPNALGHRIMLKRDVAGLMTGGNSSVDAAGAVVVREVLASVPVPLRA